MKTAVINTMILLTVDCPDCGDIVDIGQEAERINKRKYAGPLVCGCGFKFRAVTHNRK